jgi:hypothetical protein
MNTAEARRRVEAAVDQILHLPGGMAELGLAMFVVDRSDEYRWVGRGEALKLFNARIDQLDAESQEDDAARITDAGVAMEGLVTTLERAGRGEYRLRDLRA